jgi:hypothetical protein
VDASVVEVRAKEPWKAGASPLVVTITCTLTSD